MRIAVCGSHATGKSTLLQELARHRPEFTIVDESYDRLIALGHVFTEAPSIEDFELLFDDAIATVNAPSATSVAFERSPADYLAYLVALEPDSTFAERVKQTAAALATLDLVVFVPIESRDRISTTELPRLRRRVDALLRDMLVKQTWGFDVPVVEVRGTPRERVEMVTEYLESLIAGQ